MNATLCACGNTKRKQVSGCLHSWLATHPSQTVTATGGFLPLLLCPCACAWADGGGQALRLTRCTVQLVIQRAWCGLDGRASAVSGRVSAVLQEGAGREGAG
jgi:hypothetical protein